MMGATSLLYDTGAFLLFTLEFYHVLAHCMILCGVRTLPRRDLLRVRTYFLVDSLTVVCSSLLLTRRFQWLMGLHLVQHLFYYITWDKSYLAKKIIDWSSLEYCNKSHPIELDSTLGTMFDVLVHLAMMYSIYPLLNASGLIVALLLAQVLLFSVLFNPRFAWANPRNMPKWVEKRLGKLSLKRDSTTGPESEQEVNPSNSNSNDSTGNQNKQLETNHYALLYILLILIFFASIYSSIYYS